MPDHELSLMNCKPNMNLSENVREIKEHSTKYINGKKILKGKFYWQEGFEAFTVSTKDDELAKCNRPSITIQNACKS